MKYTHNVVLGVVAAALPLAAADIPTSFWRKPETSSALAGSSGLACVDSCDCMPKLCMDDAVIKGTTTHLTYLCPETKTVQVTETIFVTVHDGESKLPAASTSVPGDNEETTTVVATGKSTLFVTKTVMSKHPTLSSASTAVATGDPDYPEPSVPIQNHPEPTTTVHVTLKSTTTVLETVSAHSILPFHPLHPTDLIPTNPLRQSATASGLWLNTTASEIVSQSSSGMESNSTLRLPMVPRTTTTSISVSTDGIATSSDTESKSTLYLTMPSPTSSTIAPVSTHSVTASSAINFTLPLEKPSTIKNLESMFHLTFPLAFPSHRASTATFVSTDGVANSSAIKSTLTLVMPSATPPALGYNFSSVSSVIDLVLTPVMPVVTPGLPDDRPTSGLAQFTISVSGNFISLPSDSETSWSIAGEDSTVTDMESFPSVGSATPTPEVSVSTDGTFISLDAPPYPTAAPVKRHDGEQQSHVDGTISMVHMTTTVALQRKNSTAIATGRSGTVSGSYPGMTILSPNGARNTQPSPAWVIVIALPLAALF